MKINKATIVFHSVCANNYLIAKQFCEELKRYDVNVRMYRVADDDYEELSKNFDASREYRDEIMNVGIANVDDILDSDLIIIGSPTYYGNVSAEMKTFMDSFAPHWLEAKFYGKNLLSFATCANPEGGGDMCLKAINTFGQHMGMTLLSIPADLVEGQSSPAYGLLHYAGEMANIRPGQKIEKEVRAIIERIMAI